MDAVTRPTISFTVPGVAVPWARVGMRGTRQFTPTKQRNFMATIKAMAIEKMTGPPLDCPVELLVQAKYVPPQSWSGKKRADARWKASKPDADNLVKILKDALKGVTWIDDAQIASLHVWKRYSDRAELVVSIRGLE